MLPLTIAKPLTFRAITPGTVTCVGLFGTCFVNESGNPTTASGTMLFQGIHFTAGLAGYLTGPIVLEDCVMTSPNGTPLTVWGGSVHLLRCQLLSSPNWLGSVSTVLVTDSHITLVDSNITAQDDDANANAIRLVRSTLQGSGLSVQASGAPAVNADATSFLWLSDSTVTTTPSSCAIVGGTARAARLVSVPDCGTVMVGSLLGAHGQPLQSGSPFQIGFRTDPSHVIAVFASTRLATTPVWPGTEQPFVLEPTDAALVWTLGTDSNGDATTTWDVPSLPSLVNQTFWFQALDCNSTPLQLSPLLGGVVR